MQKNDKPNQDAQTPKPAEGARQTDLAEGELDTVEESLRKHEEKGDVQAPRSPQKDK